MRYPSWFPRPRSWLQAIILALTIGPIAVVTRMVGEMAFNFFRVGWEPDDWRVWAWIFASLIPSIWILAHVHQFLWGEPDPKYPKWLPSLRSWGEGAYSGFVAIVAIVLFAVCAFSNQSRYARPDDSRLQFAGVVFILTAAYLYHLKALITDRQKPRADS